MKTKNKNRKKQAFAALFTALIIVFVAYAADRYWWSTREEAQSLSATLSKKPFLADFTIRATVNGQTLATLIKYDGSVSGLLLTHSEELVTSNRSKSLGHGELVLGLASLKFEVPSDSVDDIDPLNSVYRFQYAVYERNAVDELNLDWGRKLFEGEIEVQVESALRDH